MNDFDYAFTTQFEEMKYDIAELMWEETQGALDRMTAFFRFQLRWYEETQDPFFTNELRQLLERECNRLVEHEPR